MLLEAYPLVVFQCFKKGGRKKDRGNCSHFPLPWQEYSVSEIQGRRYIGKSDFRCHPQTWPPGLCKHRVMSSKHVAIGCLAHGTLLQTEHCCSLPTTVVPLAVSRSLGPVVLQCPCIPRTCKGPIACVGASLCGSCSIKADQHRSVLPSVVAESPSLKVFMENLARFLLTRLGLGPLAALTVWCSG